MARKPNPMPELKTHKASGLFYVFLSGKRHYLGRDLEAAEKERRRLVAEYVVSSLDAPRPRGMPSTLTVAEGMLAWMKHVYDTEPDQRTRSRRQIAADMAAEMHGTIRLSDFDQEHLALIRTRFLGMTSAKTGRPLSRRYVNHLVASIILAWDWLALKKLVPYDAPGRLRTVKPLRRGKGGVERPRVRAVDDWIVEATLPYCNAAVAAMVQLQRLAGMRPGEVVRMQRADLSCSPAEVMEVPDTNPPQRVRALEVGGVLVWVYVPLQHKTLSRGKRRITALGPRAQAVLAPFLERDGYLFSPREMVAAKNVAQRRKKPKHWKPRSRWKRGPGERYTTASYERSIGYAIRRANKERAEPIPHWTPNMLRKAAATAVENFGTRDDAAAVLGHESPDMTAIYSEFQLRKAAEIVAKIG